MACRLKSLLVCPTLNPGASFSEWIVALKSQEYYPDKVLIIDSGSNDHSVVLAENAQLEVSQIAKLEFDHGGTRQKAVVENPGYGIVIFLTQDAILSNPDDLQKIMQYFENENIAAVCGRQLPRKQAGVIVRHARLFNYPQESVIRKYDDKAELGLKTAFLSNSFAAYRVSALLEVGGFPTNVIFGEDMYIAAKLLKAGYSIAYAADACVYHSHAYSIFQEMERYFDMGVFHAREPWLKQEFGGAEKEGLKFIESELRYIWQHAFWRIPEALLRTVFRYIGYKTGKVERYIPLKIKRKISMNPGYFNTA